MEELTEDSLEVFENRSILKRNDRSYVYEEGLQSKAATERYTKIKEEFEAGFLETMYAEVRAGDLGEFAPDDATLLKSLTSGVTSDMGRAIAALSILLMAIKSIEPRQCVRLHKGSAKLQNSFSWTEGISMRVLDKNYVTPFLRKHQLIKLNADGLFMTRSLAENYPFSKLYKARVKGPFSEWVELVDRLEDGSLSAKSGLKHAIKFLLDQSVEFSATADEAVRLVTEKAKSLDFNSIRNLLIAFSDKASHAARVFEIIIHAFMQVMIENGHSELELKQLSQMRTANKKAGTVGDIELYDGANLIEAWDAKYGKEYLRDELEELKDKIKNEHTILIAGFVGNSRIDKRTEIMARVDEIGMECGVQICLMNITEWLALKTSNMKTEAKNLLGRQWLVAVTECLAQRRRKQAPIDEPCLNWLQTLIAMFK